MLSSGAVIIFTGIASMIFLKSRLQAYRWVGMVVVVIGLAVVGVADILLTEEDDDTSTSDIIIGDNCYLDSKEKIEKNCKN